MDRTKLPYRKNCEGYFITKSRKILARDTGKGFVEFPGGGVDESEEPGEALLREAYEETGLILDGTLKKIGVIHFDWSPSWAKTEKQKKRYNQFRGEEMHLFSGKVKELEKPKGDCKTGECGWKEDEREMDIAEAIKLIETLPSDASMKVYREVQLRALREMEKSQSFCTPHEGYSPIIDIIHSLFSDKSIKILEIGCGSGVNLVELNRLGFMNLHAIDINENKIKEAKIKSGKTHFYNKDALDIKFDKNSFDFIFHNQVTMFLEPEKRKELVKKIVDWLKPNGIYALGELLREKNENQNGKVYFYTSKEIAGLSVYFNKIMQKEASREVHGKIIPGGIIFVGKKK